MTILVTGATGNIGRMVVDHLVAGGAPSVRALTTDPERAALPDSVRVARGYLRRPDTLPAALAGVERMYLAPTPDTATEVLTLAREAGVAHVVDLSGEPSTWWGAVTAAVEDSGRAWTHLWPGDFMENTRVLGAADRGVRTVREPHPDGRSAPIARTPRCSAADSATRRAGRWPPSGGRRPGLRGVWQRGRPSVGGAEGHSGAASSRRP